MDEISILRQVRTDLPERSADAVASGRARLFEAITESAPKVRMKKRLRPVGRWTGGIVAGGVTLALALAGVAVFAPSGLGGADPAAASILAEAADATIGSEDPDIPTGKYLLVETEAVYLSQGSLPGREGDLGDDDFTTFFESFRGQVFVPASRTDDWVWVQYARVPAGAYTPEGDQLAYELTRDETNQLRILPGGMRPNGTSIDSDYASLPRDPDALLEAVYDLSDQSPVARLDSTDDSQVRLSREGRAFFWIADILRQGTAPADLRAALYETAAKIPGVSITEEAATLDGTTGVAIGRTETSSNTRQDLIIDPSTGQFIGERQVTVSGFGDVPPGTTTSWTSVTTSIVDTAPRTVDDLDD